MARTYSEISAGRLIHLFFFLFFFKGRATHFPSEEHWCRNTMTGWYRLPRSQNVQDGPAVVSLRALPLVTDTLFISGSKSRLKSVPSICQTGCLSSGCWPITRPLSCLRVYLMVVFQYVPTPDFARLPSTASDAPHCMFSKENGSCSRQNLGPGASCSVPRK